METHATNNSSTTVGVLSDTHGRFQNSLYAALADCDYIIHAGDIGDPRILRDLETLAPVVAVLGNNDFDEYGESVTTIAKPTIAGVRFFVSHYPQDTDLRKQGHLHFAPGEPLPQICIHGHTHVPRIVTGNEASPADLILCPGATFRPRNGSNRSIAKIVLNDERFQDVWIEEV